MDRPGYVNVDQLQSETTLEAAAAKCGVKLELRGAGPEVRIDCPFGCRGDHAGRKEVAINTANPQKVFLCHSYQCSFRGNLLTLLHGWLHGTRPSGGKLKGEEFHKVKAILAGKVDAEVRQVLASKADPSPAPNTPPLSVNVALIDSPEERVRDLHNIDAKFVRDVATMNSAAAAYVRSHQCLTLDSMAKWRCGYLPNDGGGDKRGWSLRGGMVYPVLSESGKVLAWAGRDVRHDEKEQAFLRLLPEVRRGVDPPAKHRFPKGFHRGLELYGQHAARLKEPGYREFIARNGLVVVEGFNDVIGLDALGVPAVALMSNRMTDAQGDKIARFAKQLAAGRVALLFDCDPGGVEGAKDALWQLAQRQLDVRVAWTPTTHGGAFAGRQPESLTRDELSILGLE